MSERIVVVGGGIAGLTAALEAATLIGDAEVIVREPSDRVGGHIRTTPFGAHGPVDEAADAFLARVPHARELAHRVGLGHDLEPPAAASAAIWHGRLHPIPDGIVLGVPGNLRAMATSRLLSWPAKARATFDLVAPRRDPGDSIGGLIRGRFGDEVADRLVDALVGSIYAADTDRFSLDMVPQLASLAASDRSLLVAAARTRRRAAKPRHRPRTTVPTPADDPVFLAPTGGMGQLVDATADAARAAGVRIEFGAGVVRLDHDTTSPARWRVDDRHADAVIVAAPAAAAGAMLRGHPELAAHLERIGTAGVALVTMSVPGDEWPERLRGRSGYLVPKSVQRRVTAVSFGSQKWRRWMASDRAELLRVSIGRDGAPFDDLDDDQLVETAVDEVSEQLGVGLRPVATRVSRWPSAFPQYRPGHRRWLSDLERLAPPGLWFAGASYDGIGIPACVAQGRAAARGVAEHLGRLPGCQ